jgi:hypothetical protein
MLNKEKKARNLFTTENSFEVYLRCKILQSKVTFYGAIYKSNNFSKQVALSELNYISLEYNFVAFFANKVDENKRLSSLESFLYKLQSSFV